MRALVRILVVLLVVVVAIFAFQSRQRAGDNNRAVRLMNEGKYKEAVEVLERAQAANPGNAMIQKNLAEARGHLDESGESAPPVSPGEEQGLRERAAKRIERMKAEGWQDDTASLEITLATAQTEVAMGHTKNAIILLERALFKQPDDLELELRIELLEQQLAATPQNTQTAP